MIVYIICQFICYQYFYRINLPVPSLINSKIISIKSNKLLLLRHEGGGRSPGKNKFFMQIFWHGNHIRNHMIAATDTWRAQSALPSAPLSKMRPHCCWPVCCWPVCCWPVCCNVRTHRCLTLSPPSAFSCSGALRANFQDPTPRMPYCFKTGQDILCTKKGARRFLQQ